MRRNGLIRSPVGRLIALAMSITICLAFFAPALAWGPQGHRIAAEIAQLRLEPAVANTIENEFSINHLADVANWADEIKGERRETRPWHYANIAAGEFVYSRRRDCSEGNCVVEKIREFERKLRTRKGSQQHRKEVLMYLVHFVADVHQPLHLGNAEDRGGNTIKIVAGKETTNLHAVWDHDLIHLKGQSLLNYATRLARDITRQEAAAWVESGVTGWANESRKLALHQVYPLELSSDGELSARYVAAGRNTVELQLKKAGVRLAHLLNKIFKN